MKISTQWRIVLGCFLFLLLFAPVAGSAYSKFVDYADHGRFGFQALSRKDQTTINSINRAELKSQLEIGDEMLAINGAEGSALNAESARVYLSKPGTAYRLTIRRAGQTIDLSMRTLLCPGRIGAKRLR